MITGPAPRVAAAGGGPLVSTARVQLRQRGDLIRFRAPIGRYGCGGRGELTIEMSDGSRRRLRRLTDHLFRLGEVAP